MTDVSWSRCGGEDCVRVVGGTPDARLQVRAGGAGSQAWAGGGGMAGRCVRDGPDVCFVPRFAFVDGTSYAVLVDGVEAATLVRPRPDRAATAEVVEIRPTATDVPRNLLRFYVQFSVPMCEGCAARQVRLVDDGGEVLAGALLPTEYELWDRDRRRLTVLLDPARIKRGLVPHRQAGYPLRSGSSIRVVVGNGFRDARGDPLRAGAERRYQVGGDERRRVDPDGWALGVPSCDTVDPVQVEFGRPLDHALLGRCLHVVGPDGQVVGGRIEVGPGERSWTLTPSATWVPGPHRLVVDPGLEDVAGNSVRRVFDRDLARPEDEPREDGPMVLIFHPS
jgi:hypothetical protein